MSKRTQENRRSHDSLNDHRKIHLFVEGLSETAYFERFRGNSSRYTLRIHDCHGYIYSARKNAAKLNEKHPPGRNDIAAVVMDKDANSIETMLELEQEYRKEGISLYVSNPSFEVLLLMHYTIPSGDLHQKDLEDLLSMRLGHKYEKSKGIPDDADPHVAIENAEKVLPDADTESCLRHPLSTTVHILVRSILDAA